MGGLLQGKVVFLTGASKGIGLAMARLFAREGARLALVARSEAGLRQVLDAVGGQARAVSIACDVRLTWAVEKAVAETQAAFGQIDILVNNAGVNRPGPFLELSESEIDWILEVNLKGAIMATRAVLPLMLERRQGTIINVASDLGLRPAPERALYCATKYGLVGFTEALRLEVAGRGIRVAALCPGLVKTDFGGIPASAKDAGMEPETVAQAALSIATLPEGAMVGKLVLHSQSLR